jgi:Tol biopolymer transport system component
MTMHARLGAAAVLRQVAASTVTHLSWHSFLTGAALPKRVGVLLTLALFVASCGGDDGLSSTMTSTTTSTTSTTVPVEPTQAPHDIVPLILFTRTQLGDDLQTFTIGVDGSQPTELTAVRDCCGVWSPDGTIIVVPDNLASSRLIPATVNPDGTRYAVHSIGPPTLNLAPGGWSPDGNRIVFEGWDDTDPSRTGLYVSEGSSLAEAAPVQITQALVHDIGLEWSPDGTRLLLIQVTRCPEGDCNGGDLYVVDSDGSDLTRLNPEGTFVACCGPASWSPDGTQVTFGAPGLDAAGAPDFTRSAVYVAEVDGSRVEAITEPGAFTETARWSPTGDWIVFNKKSGPIGVKGSDLYLVHPDGSGLSAITTAGSAGLSDQVGALWSPDGTRLLFTVVPGGPVKRGDLWIVDLDGTDLTRLTDTPAQYFGYSWQPGN